MKILISAGNTREYIDPVRFISNVSTGYLGYCIAEASTKKGNVTTLVSGPTEFDPPKKVKFIQIESSDEMQFALKKEFNACDCLFMTSAVCDYKPVRRVHHKIKRSGKISIDLTATVDILKSLTEKKKDQIVFGFCLETRDLIRNAKRKLKEKRLDFIVANYLGTQNQPFGKKKTSVFLLGKDGREEHWENISKAQVAVRLLKLATHSYQAR